MVILSGGQDSSTCLFWAKQHFSEVHAVSVDYGQRHSIELESARTVAALADVKSHEIITLGPILKGRSPLTNPAEHLETYNNFTEMDKTIGDRVELTFVPMRNALFMVLAANHAVAMDCFDLVAGVCQADNANYPDCRQSYVDSMEHTIRQALGFDVTGQRFRIYTPLMEMSKAQSIALAVSIRGAYEALAYSHTAYDGKYPPTGNDHASTLRAHGFVEAEVPDPLVVRAWYEGHMDLPDTDNYNFLRMKVNPGRLTTGMLPELLEIAKASH